MLFLHCHLLNPTNEHTTLVRLRVVTLVIYCAPPAQSRSFSSPINLSAVISFQLFVSRALFASRHNVRSVRHHHRSRPPYRSPLPVYYRADAGGFTPL